MERNFNGKVILSAVEEEGARHVQRINELIMSGKCNGKEVQREYDDNQRVVSIVTLKNSAQLPRK